MTKEDIRNLSLIASNCALPKVQRDELHAIITREKATANGSIMRVIPYDEFKDQLETEIDILKMNEEEYASKKEYHLAHDYKEERGCYEVVLGWIKERMTEIEVES